MKLKRKETKQMKRLFLITAVCAGLLSMTALPSYAVRPLALEDEEYKVFMICADDAGDYCNKGDSRDDTFQFKNDDEFVLESFEDELWGLGNEGSYDDKGSYFSADYGAINDSGDKYEFEIKGIVLLDNLMLGTMDIVYSKLHILNFEKEDETKAFFIAMKK
jgi:hypothetical protein